jgi:glycosyltransferase involved in cell wall biosynthesis
LAGRIVDKVRWAVGYARTVRAWGRATVRAAGDVDVWHAHDLTGLLAVGPLVRPPCRLVYDSHEIFLETGSAKRLPRSVRRLLSAYEGRLARRAVALITVNEGYADVLARRLRPARTIVVRNCPPRWSPPEDAAGRLRSTANVPAGLPLVLYHGVFDAGRGVEELAEAMLAPGLETAHLALLGYGSNRLALERLALEERFGGRIHVLDAVPPTELLAWVAGADVDVIPLQRANLNLWLCSPNKLWESLAAGVPVVVSDFPVMRRVVLDDPAGLLGGVCEPASPASIGAAINAIVDLSESDRDVLRRRCLAAAHERWNWEGESAHLVELYEQLSVRR